ncbi:hypothetical protein TcG_13069 [Trypanosoma cruzi]|nr:hypothetical protein TcG_13069 [Trypanosoma cruzi]
MKRRKEEAVRVRRGSHPLWKCCTACGGIALKCRTITHEDVARSGISFFCLRVCCCGCGCVCVGRVGTMAAEGLAHPTQHRFCRASSITLQHRNRRHQHAARQRMPPPPRVRPEGTRLMLRFGGAHRVAQWRAQNLIAGSAHDTGHWMWGVCVMKDTAVESLLPPGGRTPDFTLFPTQADGCAMTPQRGIRFHNGGAISVGLGIGNVNDKCSIEGSPIVVLCCANCGDFP